MSDKPTPEEAWADLKRTVWATLEPPLARLVGWLNRLFDRSKGK